MSVSNFFGRFGRRFTAPDLSRAFKEVFQSQLGLDFVLPAIAEYCHAAERSPEISDMYLQGRAAGKRDVWLFIQEHIKLPEAQIYELYVKSAKEIR